MANLLTIEKLDNDVFLFVLNGITPGLMNKRNDLTIDKNKCHFKTANGANIIKEQDIVFGNVTLKDGATTIVPTSNDNLFDELTALGYFDWFTSSGGGVDRFTDLLDGFSFTNQALKFARVNAAETQLEAVEISLVENSTELGDMPSSIVPGKLLIGNTVATAYEQIDPIDLPISSAVIDAISAITGITFESVDYPELTVDGVQDFIIPLDKVAVFAYINDGVQYLETVANADKVNTFTQTDNVVTMKQDTYINNLVTIFYK